MYHQTINATSQFSPQIAEEFYNNFQRTTIEVTSPCFVTPLTFNIPEIIYALTFCNTLALFSEVYLCMDIRTFLELHREYMETNVAVPYTLLY